MKNLNHSALFIAKKYSQEWKNSSRVGKERFEICSRWQPRALLASTSYNIFPVQICSLTMSILPATTYGLKRSCNGSLKMDSLQADLKGNSSKKRLQMIQQAAYTCWRFAPSGSRQVTSEYSRRRRENRI